MEFEVFKTEILVDIKEKKKHCLKKIEKNKELIQSNIGEEGDLKKIDTFVNDLNIIIFELKKFNLIESVLKHPFFSKVLEAFRNSNILIEACKAKKKIALKWLLTMDINPCVQDDKGMTALMYAAESNLLFFVVQDLVKKDNCINLLDTNGDNALYHALDNVEALKELVKTDIDANCKHDGENLLLYCCKNDIFSPIIALVSSSNIDVNVVDKEGKTAAMYLAVKGREKEFESLCIKETCNFDYRNEDNESVLSILIQKLYVEYSDLFPHYLRMIAMLVKSNCNFNLPVDNIGNSALMAFMIIGDYYSSYYIAKYNPSIDLTVKNQFGENPSSLCIKLKDNENLLKTFKSLPTFDVNYIDPNTNNTMLMLCSMKGDATFVTELIENNVNIINDVNNRNENSLILATKFSKIAVVETLLKHGIFVNQQDYLGNTALYYAVDLNNIRLIKLLLKYKADMNIKNNEGVSTLNYAHSIADKNILNILTNPDDNSSSIIDSKVVSEENKPENKYRETFEYLYPCINNDYPKFEMTYPIECLLRSIYSGELGRLNYPEAALGVLPYIGNAGSSSVPLYSEFKY